MQGAIIAAMAVVAVLWPGASLQPGAAQ